MASISLKKRASFLSATRHHQCNQASSKKNSKHISGSQITIYNHSTVRKQRVSQFETEGEVWSNRKTTATMTPTF